MPYSAKRPCQSVLPRLGRCNHFAHVQYQKIVQKLELWEIYIGRISEIYIAEDCSRPCLHVKYRLEPIIHDTICVIICKKACSSDRSTDHRYVIDVPLDLYRVSKELAHNSTEF
jgi:hypothetical protein